MKRRTAREKAMQAIFQIDMSAVEVEAAIEHVLEGKPSDPYFERLVTGTVQNMAEIDDMIKKHLKNWRLERLANVDRNLLRMAVYELMFCQDEVPGNVVIDEAIEVAKKYGDEKSSKFINAVLSKVKNALEQ